LQRHGYKPNGEPISLEELQAQEKEMDEFLAANKDRVSSHWLREYAPHKQKKNT